MSIKKAIKKQRKLEKAVKIIEAYSGKKYYPELFHRKTVLDLAKKIKKYGSL